MELQQVYQGHVQPPLGHSQEVIRTTYRSCTLVKDTYSEILKLHQKDSDLKQEITEELVMRCQERC